MLLPDLYHWSPADRFDAISRDGLRPHSRPTVCQTTTLSYVCLSPNPARAWSLSGDMDWTAEVDDWDLWQVRLADGDNVRIRPEFGREVMEIKVFGPIPADRVWWVARRISTPANTCLPVEGATS
ncbi:hypothetical protein AB0F93_00180 [Micromonospora tulbaghiae]|uniref:hypothetical protein n=1 Tax=Micromonospora tulbaghiae TaxID=479978 RepID=UPI0033293C43